MTTNLVLQRKVGLIATISGVSGNARAPDVGQNAATLRCNIRFRKYKIAGITPVSWEEKYDGRRYEVYRGGTRSVALEFLKSIPTSEIPRLFYIIVETPQGNIGKDLTNIFDEATGSIIEVSPQPNIEKLLAALTQDRSAGDTLVQMSEAAVEPLIEVTKEDDWQRQYVAAELLGRIGDTRAVDPLIALLWNRGSGEMAAKALGKIKDPRAVEPLIELLKSTRTSNVRSAAAEALGELGGTQVIDPLTEAIKDKDIAVRYEAERALKKLGHSA